MKRFTTFLALIFFCTQGHGQVNKYGIPLIKNYNTQVMQSSDYTHSIIKDKLGNIYLANEDLGIIRFDGTTWRRIPVGGNELIRALGIDKQGTIYAGGKFEFGYLEPDNYGRMVYVSLSKRFNEPVNKVLNEKSDTGKTNTSVQKIKIGEILSLVVKDSNVYFVSSAGLFDYNILKDTLTYINLQNYNLKNVLKVFLVGEKIIIGDNTSGLFEFRENKIEPLPGGSFFKMMRCMIVMPYDESHAMVATFNNGVFLYNYVTGEVNKDFIEPSLLKLLIGSRIYSGTALPSGEFAIGTIQDGIYIIDHNGHLTKKWDKRNSNLMDNGILSLYCDTNESSELWISTVGFIAKAYINLPFTEFSPKSGIEGGANCICEFNGNIYVSTDLGVFKSRTDENDQIGYIKIPEIIDQVFPLYNAKVENEEFLLAG